MAIKLKDLMTRTSESLTKDVEFKDGMFFTLCYVSRGKMKTLYNSCTSLRYNPTTKTRSPQTDVEKFASEFSKLAVSGWRGITPKKVAAMIPELDLSKLSEEEKSADLPFDHDQLSVLVSNSVDLDNFIQEMAVDPKIFTPEHEEELGNSESSQTGN